MDKKKENIKKEIKDCKKNTDKIAIFSKSYVENRPMSPQSFHPVFKGWKKDTIIRNQDEIKDLLNKGAPLEVFVKDGGIY